MRGLLQAYGPASVKRHLWNSEFAQGRWNCLDETRGDCVYGPVEKHAKRGRILDLGCGSGTTGIEIDPNAYEHYTGVDISEVAIEKARRRSAESGRADKHTFVQSDIVSYAPEGTFDVILFRDSIYYVPHGRIVGMVERYAACLRRGGAFIVRMASGNEKYQAIVDTIRSRFDVIDEIASDDPRAVVVVFRPRLIELR